MATENKTKEDIVEQKAKFEPEQRKKEGDEEGLKELSNYWLKLRIFQQRSREGARACSAAGTFVGK